MDLQVTIGGGSDMAAWAQAITSGAAVLVALFLPWWQQRIADRREQADRLAVDVITSISRTMMVRLQYRPKDKRLGLSARIAIHHPHDAALVSWDLVEPPGPMGYEGRAWVSEAVPGVRALSIRMRPTNDGPIGALDGLFYIRTPAAWDMKAVISVTIITESLEPTSLFSARVPISPSDP